MHNHKELLRRALSNAKPAAPSADGPAEPEPKVKACLGAAYDSKEPYRLFEGHGVGGPVPARRNFGQRRRIRGPQGGRIPAAGGFGKIDRDAQQKFARMTDEQKAAKARGCGRAATTRASP